MMTIVVVVGGAINTSETPNKPSCDGLDLLRETLDKLLSVQGWDSQNVTGVSACGAASELSLGC